jgi:hypothetical protein
VSKRPMARRHLNRLHELVTNASICRVVEEKGIFEHPSILRAATADRGIAEEIQSLAGDRDWTVLHSKSYAWSMLANYSDPAPRILRIVKRDLAELNEIYRETDDDDVASIALRVQSERMTLRRELEQERPELTLPGAK